MDKVKLLFDNDNNKIQFIWNKNIKLNYPLNEYMKYDFSIFDLIVTRHDHKNQESIDILNFLFKIKEMNKNKGQFKEAIVFYTGTREQKLKQLLRHPNDFNYRISSISTQQEYTDISNIDCNQFDFEYQVLKSILTNIHNRNDDLFAQIMNCSSKTKGENYVMFLLAKHGDNQYQK